MRVWWSNSGEDQNWLNHRFNLFDKYCYPSVCSQTNSNFKWIVLFDSQTNRELISQYDHFIPIFVDSFDIDVKDINHTTHDGKIYHVAHNRELQSLIKEMTEEEFIITTRLDNDDAISTDFVESVQNNFQEVEEILNIRNGYTLLNSKFYERTLWSNPFMSMIEKATSDFKTVYGVPHWAANKFMPVRQIEEKRSWIQIIHDNNHTNQKKINELNLNNFKTSLDSRFHINGHIPLL